jgi:dihydrolipoamide dehydrogenase
MSEKYYAVVIGGGPGGTPAAMALASAGKKVLLVEETGKLGGACLFIGCIPSKIIKYTADEAIALQKAGGKYGTEQSIDYQKTWNYIQKKMDRILEGRSESALKKAKSIPGLTVLKGKATFTAANSIEINTGNGEKKEATFEKAIIAAGARSWIPPFIGDGVQNVLVTENFFRINKIPESLAIIGGGPIGIEIAQMMSHLGVKVTVVEVMDSILKGLVESDFAESLYKNLLDTGIKVYLSSQVTKIDKTENGFSLEIRTTDGIEQNLETEKILVSAGKIPNIDGLGLDTIKMEYTKKGIITNEFLETSIPGIYAAGDVTTGPKFAHLATHETQIAVRNILLENRFKVEYSKNTWVLFSEPEIAVAGVTEEQAKQSGLSTIEGTYKYQIDATAQIQESTSGLLRFIVDQKTDRIVGIHIIGKGASEVVGEAALIVSKGLTLSDVAAAIHPHPTLTEAFGFLANEMIQRKIMQKGIVK